MPTKILPLKHPRLSQATERLKIFSRERLSDLIHRIIYIDRVTLFPTLDSNQNKAAGITKESQSNRMPSSIPRPCLLQRKWAEAAAVRVICPFVLFAIAYRLFNFTPYMAAWIQANAKDCSAPQLGVNRRGKASPAQAQPMAGSNQTHIWHIEDGSVSIGLDSSFYAASPAASTRKVADLIDF